MTDDLAIRRYRPGDRNAVWRVHDRAFRASPVEFDPELDRHLRAVPESFLDPGGEFLVGTVPGSGESETDGRPIPTGAAGDRVVAVGGFVPSTAAAASVRPTAPVEADEGTVEVRSLRVDPDVQGQGVGRAVVERLEARARDEGFRRVVLDTSEHLTAARSLYESLGYDPAGRESFESFELVYFEKGI